MLGALQLEVVPQFLLWRDTELLPGGGGGGGGGGASILSVATFLVHGSSEKKS